MPETSINPPLLAHFLSEQQSLTAVERFSDYHDQDRPGQERYYRDLLPLRFVQAAELPLEIQPPDLPVGVRELQRAKRNLDFGVPPHFADARLHFPDPVPVAVVLAALIRHLRVPLGARRVGGELIAVALVVERVKNDPERVAGVRVEVLLQIVDDEPARFAVVGENAKVDRLVVV